MNENGTKYRYSLRRLINWLGVGVGGLLGLVLVTLLLFLFAPVRHAILTMVLSRTADALPGELVIRRAAWPAPGTLEFEDVVWVDESDSLFAANRVAVSVDLWSLMRKDVRINSVDLRRGYLDIPATTARFPADSVAGTGESAGSGGRGFPRGGSLPGLPSVGIDRINLRLDSLRLTGTHVLSDIAFAGGFDFTYGDPPRVAIDTLAAREPGGQWEVGPLSLQVDIDKGLLDGRGRGTISPQRLFVFSLTSDASDHFALVISTTDSVAVEDAPMIRVDGTIERDDLAIRSLEFESKVRTPSTSELAKDPLLSSYMEALPALSGIELAVAGAIAFEPEISMELDCEIMKNDWIDSARLSLDYAPDLLTVDSLSVALEGLALEASGRMAQDSVAVVGDIRIRGTSWLDTLVPESGVPDDLSADIHADVVKLNNENMVVANVDAAATIGEFAIDSFHVDTDFALDVEKPSRVLVIAHAMDMNLGVGAVVTRRSGVEANLSPIVIRDPAIPRSLLSVVDGAPGQFRFVSKTGDLSIENITVTGDQGDIHLSANRGGDGEGAYDIRCSWSEPPALLVQTLGLADSTVDSLQSAWRRDAPFEFSAAGEFSTGDSLRMGASGNFKLPGPRTLTVLLSDSVQVDDLGPLSGWFEATARSDTVGMDFNVTLDLDSTTWIDSSVVNVRGEGERVVVDSLGLAVVGADVGLRGTIDDGICDLYGLVELADAEFARRFVKAVPDVTLRADARFRGTIENPNLAATIEGSISGEGYEIPELAGAVDVGDKGFSAMLNLPKGAKTSQVQLDSVKVSASSVGNGNALVPIALTLDAVGQDLRLYQALVIDTMGGLDVDVDTLFLNVGRQDLGTTRPFRIRAQTESRTITVDNLDLEGSIGKINVTGFVNPDSSDLAAVVKVTLPKEPPSGLVRPHLWPERIDADLRAKGRHEVDAQVHIDGFALVDDTRPELDAELIGRSGELRAKISVADASGTLIEGAGRLPASVVVYPPSAEFHDGPVVLDVKLDRVPVAGRVLGRSKQIPKDEIVYVDGYIKLRGTTDEPQAVIHVTGDFSGWPKMSVYDLAIGAVLSSGGALDSTLAAPIDGFVGLPPAPDHGGLTAAVRLLRENRPVLTAAASYPLTVQLNPPLATAIEGKDLHVQVDGDSIPLADFDPLLPLDIGLGGRLQLALTAEGPPENPAINGSVTSRRLEVSVAQQGQSRAHADMRIEGTRLRPVIRGDIQIDNALIRVPDLPKDLHPIEGDAILDREDGPDTTGGFQTAPPEQTVEDRMDVGDQTDIEVTVRIPNGFWIRGKGLDMELTGDLNLVQRGGQAVVTGELRAIRGTLVMLGRTLQLERGTVTFFGGDEINPSLDIVLTTTIDNTEIKILFGGTVQKPQMNLNSIPEMQEADIVSLLLFGRSYQNLDDSQTDLVQQRSTEIIASVGAVKLQEELGGQMGIDVVSVKSTGRDNESAALAFGKYISPRVLLSYAYALDSSADSFLSLEYFIKGQFKIESTYGNREGQSSLGVGWAKDY